MVADGSASERMDLFVESSASDRPLDGLLTTQREAATHTDARLVILGAAGTGKTRAVEARFRWLVAEGCAPERIGLLVPTDARAAALRARIETRLARGYDELYVLTPAQLAGLVLRAAGAGADPFESVLTPGDRLAMLVERYAKDVGAVTALHPSSKQARAALKRASEMTFEAYKAEVLPYLEKSKRKEHGSRQSWEEKMAVVVQALEIFSRSFRISSVTLMGERFSFP